MVFGLLLRSLRGVKPSPLRFQHIVNLSDEFEQFFGITLDGSLLTKVDEAVFLFTYHGRTLGLDR